MSPRWMPASLEILPPAHIHTNRLVRNATNVRSSFVNAEAMRDANKTQDRYLGTSKQIITTDIRYTIFLNNNILRSTVNLMMMAMHTRTFTTEFYNFEVDVRMSPRVTGL